MNESSSSLLQWRFIAKGEAGGRPTTGVVGSERQDHDLRPPILLSNLTAQLSTDYLSTPLLRRPNESPPPSRRRCASHERAGPMTIM
jgi:hypothetical protein